jgi:CMP/dCMP kinase
MEPLIVAIDGPSGVGKTTTSRLVAGKLSIPHIDTGAMYRAIALKASEAGVDAAEGDALERLARASTIEFAQKDGEQRVVLDGRDVTEEIRRPEMSMLASSVSAVGEVRRVLVALQQELGRRRGGVLEGRDIGTKVFPATPHKFFLTARPEVRAERRLRDLEAKGMSVPLGQVRADMETRDAQDSTRSDSPLRYDESYTVIDTSDLTIEEVVAEIVAKVREKATPTP